ncbi:hypothetical protein AVEN_77381-1 [Araneus ventricosus]|uniref:Uncharacterized protein n=1 Tax=Araneus ventricosus TaxID=182803 RepID=A0A4Y2CA73_ARAVE|nr:hypothetical protein AVEN_77381-1 [Araneus ventricosus]
MTRTTPEQAPPRQTSAQHMDLHWNRVSNLGPSSLDAETLQLGLRGPLGVRASFGRGRTVAGDGHYDSGLSTRAIAATVTQIHRAENAPDRGDLDMCQH